MAVSPIKMPQLGESVTEGTVDKWLKHEGDFVKRDEPIVEVVTDKVNAEIPSPFEGKLVKISVGEGETVRVGSVIAQIETAAPPPATAAAPAPDGGTRERRHGATPAPHPRGGKGRLQGPPRHRAHLPAVRRPDRGRAAEAVSLAQLLLDRRGRRPEALSQPGNRGRHPGRAYRPGREGRRPTRLHRPVARDE